MQCPPQLNLSWGWQASAELQDVCMPVFEAQCKTLFYTCHMFKAPKLRGCTSALHSAEHTLQQQLAAFPCTPKAAAQEGSVG